ncbi:MAG: (E)-4-hydroxy-3-methylbut-2-enyl-diphosphate synthase [Leptospira sp.]|nr:(E)-4-hydroxy-3-methylbut-2-enyl-diphosphate synthase [Leptospira sp.]NCS95183.1 (E)-4-hydroxy-3-methylbut-2-enyl-diphosphate synthase [Leptospira sp.]
MNTKYNTSPFEYNRRITHEVKVGNVGIGGLNPIRIQSMTNADTKDVEATIRQIRELQEVGSELVRLTVPTSQDAEALPIIRKRMKEENLTVPLVADIHFTPSIAMKAVEFVEKVRINPGNFADRKKFAILEYTDKEYKLELERISETFLPLVKRAKELGVAMRIGTNHGSLSDRIMNRFGDTPEGMVESALEFIRIAESIGYKDIIVSMKASNTQIMIQAYRLLIARFLELNMTYPLHLGVTEAGDGKDGRIKSAIGIGSLLDDGLGDTIRVSLTEDPVLEIPVAKIIVEKYNLLHSKNWENLTGKSASSEINSTPIQASEKRNQDSKDSTNSSFKEFRNPFQYSRFYAKEISLNSTKMGEENPIRVEVDCSQLKSNYEKEISELFLKAAPLSILPESLHFTIRNETELNELATLRNKEIVPAAFSFLLQGEMANQIHDQLSQLLAFDKWVSYYPHFGSEEEKEIFLGAISSFHKENKSIEWIIKPSEFSRIPEILEDIQKWLLSNSIFSLESSDLTRDYRKLSSFLSNYDYPISLSSVHGNQEDALYEASIGLGGLLIDGIGDILRISFPCEIFEELSLTYDILQGSRLRLTKTEYISCPSCGRTQFDLQDTTARIKKRTNHLIGVKIAVMGCIVNGPGEMADADFGYVGAAPGKVHLYKGKEIIMKNVPEDIADEKLVELIKNHDMWVEAK